MKSLYPCLFKAFDQVSFLGDLAFAHVDEDLVRLQDLVDIFFNSIPELRGGIGTVTT